MAPEMADPAGTLQNQMAKQNGDTLAPHRQRHEEDQYLDMARDILENGEHRPDR